MSDAPRIGVSVVAFHSDPEFLTATLDGVAAQQLAPVRTVLLVNEATASERQLLAGLQAEVLFEASNTGFAGGHNRVAAALFDEGLDAVVILNPDLRLHPAAIAELWRTAQAEELVCLTGPLLESGDDRLAGVGEIDSAGMVWTRTARHLDRLQGQPLRTAPETDMRVAGLTGACLLIPRPAYDRIVEASGELFDEDFLAYREDAELALRCAALGLPCVLSVRARGVHRRRAPGTSRSVPPHINRLGVQNRLLIRFRHGRARPGNSLLAAARDLVVVAAAATVERSSWPGVRSAWSLRRRMRQKRVAFVERRP